MGTSLKTTSFPQEQFYMQFNKGHFTNMDTLFCTIGVWIRGYPLSFLSSSLTDTSYRYPDGSGEEAAKDRSYFISQLNFELLEGAVVTGAA